MILQQLDKHGYRIGSPFEWNIQVLCTRKPKLKVLDITIGKMYEVLETKTVSILGYKITKYGIINDSGVVGFYHHSSFKPFII